MLKITFSETPAEEKWILHGRLTAPWVRELRASWKKNRQRQKGRACIVDLNEITLIDMSALMFLLCFLLARNEPGATGEVQMH